MTAGQMVGVILLAAMTAVLLYHEAGRMIERHVEAALNRSDDREDPARLTDCPVFDETIRNMPVSEAAYVVQGWLLDEDRDAERLGAEAEAWLADRDGSSS